MREVFDREGRRYEVTEDEALALLASGAYFSTPNLCGGYPKMQNTGTLIKVYDVKTGEAFTRRPVDANELVASGRFSFQPPEQAAPKQAPAPQTPPAPNSGQQSPAAPPTPPANPQQGKPLPTLTAENSKAEIIAALNEYGVQYRSNMDKADLLELWTTYVSEQQEHQN